MSPDSKTEKVPIDDTQSHQEMLGIFIGGGLSLLALILLYAALHHDAAHINNLTNVQNNRTQTILRELNDMHNEFQQLENNPESSESLKASLSEINNHIDKIQTNLATMQMDMDSKMTDLQHTVNNSPHTRSYLDAKNLPFKVISVDVISQQAFVSVNYDDHISPLGIGDTLAGWILVNTDYDQSTAVFKNDKDQYVQAIIKN